MLYEVITIVSDDSEDKNVIDQLAAAGCTVEFDPQTAILVESVTLDTNNLLLNIVITSYSIHYTKLYEISLSASTKVCEVKGDTLTYYDIDPRDYGFSLCQPNA